MTWFSSSLRDLARLRPTQGKRDFLQIRKDDKQVIADIKGAGTVFPFDAKVMKKKP